MDSDSGYDFDYDSDDGGYYESDDDGGYYYSDEEAYAGDGISEAELGVDGDNGDEVDCVDVADETEGQLRVDDPYGYEEDGAEVADEDGGDELEGEEGYGEGCEDDGVEVDLEVVVEEEEETESEYGGQFEVPIQGSDSDSDYDRRRVGIGYGTYRGESEDESELVWRISSTSLIGSGASVPVLISGREIDQEPMREINQARTVLESVRENQAPMREMNQAPMREMNQAGTIVENVREMNLAGRMLESMRENDGSGRVNDDEKGGVSDFQQEQETEEKASSSGSGVKTVNGNELDGFSCPICMELWTTEGDHSICCLPCGHVYGMSCIKSWLQQQNSAKCPQCNMACGLEDIRRIYGLVAGATEKDLQEEIKLLEAKCASLEMKDADWQRKEAEWFQKEALLLLQLKEQSTYRFSG